MPDTNDTRTNEELLRTAHHAWYEYQDFHVPDDGDAGALQSFKKMADAADAAVLARMAPGWQAVETAEKNQTPRLLKLKDRIPDERKDLRRWDGIAFVGNHPGVADDGFDMGWQFAAPVGQGGFPDEWFEGWMPVAPSPSQQGEKA